MYDRVLPLTQCTRHLGTAEITGGGRLRSHKQASSIVISERYLAIQRESTEGHAVKAACEMTFVSSVDSRKDGARTAVEMTYEVTGWTPGPQLTGGCYRDLAAQ